MTNNYTKFSMEDSRQKRELAVEIIQNKHKKYKPIKWLEFMAG